MRPFHEITTRAAALCALVSCLGADAVDNAYERSLALVKKALQAKPNDPKALLLVYEQSQWNAWAAVAPGFAALFAILDGLLPNNT